MQQPNRPHFHVWIRARTGKMFYQLAKGYHTSQAARQWAKRNYPDQERLVLKCEDPECRPKLD